MGSKGLIKVLKIISLVIILTGMYILYEKNKINDRIEVIEWNNLYNETNLDFHYSTGNEEELVQLENVYKIKRILSGTNKEIDKVLKVNEILNNIVSYDDVESSKLFNGYDILKEKGKAKKVSDRDMAIIYRDLLSSIGINARVGEFRKYRGIFQQDENYYIVEYWDKQLEKWVAVDYKEMGYFTKEDVLLSGIEIFNSKIKDIKYIGKSEEKEIYKNYKELKDAYVLNIDNTIKRELSNTTITYIKNEEEIRVMNNNKFLPSNIYTTSTTTFDKSPQDAREGKDSGGYIVIMKKEGAPNEDQSKYKNQFIIGGFNDSKILEEYYLNINNKGMEKIDKYKEIDLTDDKTTIELSLDGENVSSKVVLLRKE